MGTNVVVKHFDLPFRFGPNGHAVEVEQDTIDDVANCVEMAILLRPGDRIEVPNFGIPDPVFQLQPLHLDAIIQAVYRYEKRAELTLSQTVDLSDKTALTDRLHAVVVLRRATGR